METRKLPETTVTAGVHGGKNDCLLPIGEAADRLEARLHDRQGLRNAGRLSWDDSRAGSPVSRDGATIVDRSADGHVIGVFQIAAQGHP